MAKQTHIEGSVGTSCCKVRLMPTRWPGSLPQPNEDKIVSVVHSNTHMEWAVHDGASMHNFAPLCCWRTRLLTDDELTDGSPTTILSRHLPEAALHVFFGKTKTAGGDQMSTELALLEGSQERSVTLLTIYIVSTTLAQAESIAWYFSEIPSRIYQMSPDDFFSTAQGRCDTMGVNRLASMRAVVGNKLGHSALVIDGGTCMTYTACNEEGKLMGGGSALGLGAKFAAIAQNALSAPGMVAVAQNHEDLLFLAARDMAMANKPIPMFCSSTSETAVSSALLEVIYYWREVIKKYLDDICVTPNEEVPIITLAGDNAHLLYQLLRMEDNQLLPYNFDIRPYEVKVHKHLMAFGIANALKEKVKEHMGTPVSEFDKLLLGCRVAKEFSQLDADGERVYRGTIASAVPDLSDEQQQYIVLYDDVDTEDLNLIEVHAALVLYSHVGEKLKRKPSDVAAAKIAEKKEKAQDAANVLVNKSKNVKKAAPRIYTTVAAAPGFNPVPKAAVSKLKPAPEAAPTAVAASANKRKAVAPAAANSAKKPTPTDDKKNPNSYCNDRVAKFFQGNICFGTVTRYDAKAKYWTIDYDDGDGEDFGKVEMKDYVQMYAIHKDLDLGSK